MRIMPNWVHAAFNVSGDRAELERFRRMMIRPVEKTEPEIDHASYAEEMTIKAALPSRTLTFDFNGILPMPGPEGRQPCEVWAIENWGTKWNASNVWVNVENPDNIWFQFSTPWDFPTPVFEALAREFPTLVISGSASEENGEFELVGDFNGDEPWGPGKIDWIIITGDDDDDEDGSTEGLEEDLPT
jgi:hypothetical protein